MAASIVASDDAAAWRIGVAITIEAVAEVDSFVVLERRQELLRGRGPPFRKRGDEVEEGAGGLLAHESLQHASDGVTGAAAAGVDAAGFDLAAFVWEGPDTIAIMRRSEERGAMAGGLRRPLSEREGGEIYL